MQGTTERPHNPAKINLELNAYPGIVRKSHGGSNSTRGGLTCQRAWGTVTQHIASLSAPDARTRDDEEAKWCSD